MITATGSFTGNATAGRAITGVGFQPDLVIVKNVDSTFDTYFKTKDMPTAYSTPVRADGGGDTNHITSIDTDGFTVSADAAVNNTSASVNWIAIKDDGAGDFATISFTGNSLDDLLVFTAFQPTYALLKSTGTIVGASKFKDQASALGANGGSNVAVPNYQGTGDRPDLIYFGADGMRVSNGDASGGNLVNQSVPIYGFVFKDSANIVSGTFTGNSTVGNAVTVGFQPILVLAERAGAGQSFSAYAPEIAAGGYSQQWDGGKQTNKIMSFTSTGFTVGDDAYLNLNANATRYVALKLNSPSAGGITPGPDVAATLTTVPQGSAFFAV